MKSILKAYEVVLNGKTMWIAAPSKKVISDFFYDKKPRIHLRKDVKADTCNTIL